MLTPIFLACALAVGQPRPAEATDWLLIPLLARGQEVVYRGNFTEECLDGGVGFSRAYRVEIRAFVLDLVGREAEVACLTQLKQKPARPEGADSGPCSVRLEVAKIGAYGKVTAAAGVAGVPIEGPPTLECGMFVEVPAQRIGVGQSWEVAETNLPPRTWRVEGTENLNGTACVRLLGVQQSADWDSPRADSTAWRRKDTIWLAPRLGLVQRVERTIERRQPARREVGNRSLLRYDLETNLQFPGQMWEDRRREILLAQNLGTSLAGLLPQAGQVGPKPFEAILTKIANQLERMPQDPYPYRPIYRQLQARAEAGRRGESPPEAVARDLVPIIPVIAPHRPAPDFVAAELVTKETIRLRRLLGKPILMAFYQPGSMASTHILTFAQAVQDSFKGQVTVVGLACTEDTAAVLKQRNEMRLTFPIVAGNGLRVSFGVDATPKMVVLDKEGLVRSGVEGWGSETSREVWQELLQCLKPAGKGPSE